MQASKNPLPLLFHPVTRERWQDLETLFGPRGACSGCWCMWWRLKRKDFEHQAGEGNRLALKAIVESGEIPGLLAYTTQSEPEGTPIPVGWCSIAPREAFPVLDRSPVLKRVDDQPVWSLVCFFIDKRYRGQNISQRLIEAGLEYASAHGAQIVEAYPVDPQGKVAQTVSIFTGTAATFARLGFVEVARRSAKRPIVRYLLGKE